MGLMDGISRGIAGAARVGADLYGKGALEQERAQIQAERDARLVELQEGANIRSENRGMANRATERGAIVDETVANAPRLRDVKVEDYKATKRAEFDPEIQALQNKAKTAELTSAEQAKLDFYNANRGAILKKTRDVARAGHLDDGAGLRAVQIEAANLTLSEKKKVNELMAEAETTRDPARKAQIMQALTIRGVIKPGEYDTEKVTTEKINPDGTTSKVEHTQKRRMGSDAATKEEPAVKYDAQGRAYVKGPDGNPILKSEVDKVVEKPTVVKRGLINKSSVTAAPADKKPASAIDQIDADNIASIQPLAQQFKQAEQMFFAAARSGDVKSVDQYMQHKEALRTKLEAQVRAKFGNNSENVLKKLYAK